MRQRLIHLLLRYRKLRPLFLPRASGRLTTFAMSCGPQQLDWMAWASTTLLSSVRCILRSSQNCTQPLIDPKDDGSARPLTVMLVAYSIWAARAARLLGAWSTWFAAELVGGRGGSPPAATTGSEVSAYLSVAYANNSFLAGMCLDTIKCFDSVSLASLAVLLRRCGAPRFLFNVLELWRQLERHVWTPGGPTGISIRSVRQKGIPQGDPIAPWALNVIMAAWLKALPAVQVCRVFLDDRCLLDSRIAILSEALIRTSQFDSAFGLAIHPTKSCRFYTHEMPLANGGRWADLPLKVMIKYLGVQLETDPGIPLAFGDTRAEKLRQLMARARLLPQVRTRHLLICAVPQGMFAEGVGATIAAIRRLTTAVVQAWWGPTLHAKNRMRSVALTLGVQAPLHRAAPEVVQCYGIFISLGGLACQSALLVQDLWHVSAPGARRTAVGFARLVHIILDRLEWTWSAWDKVQDADGSSLDLIRLGSRGAAGERERHLLRNSLRTWWWRKWDGTRVAHGGLAGGVHRELTLAPLREMSLASDGSFGWDGTDNGARYRRFLADALWSRVRRGHARKVTRVRCRRCGLDDEHTDHFLWGCPANASDRRLLDAAWDATRSEDGIRSQALPDALPRCLRQCGIVPLHLPGINVAQIRCLQQYFVRVLRRWALDRDAEAPDGAAFDSDAPEGASSDSE